MRSFLLLIFCSIAFLGCKVNKFAKTPAKVIAVVEKSKVTEKTPSIVAINGKYLFEDTTRVKIFMTVELDAVEEGINWAKLDELFVIQWTVFDENTVRERIAAGKLKFTEQYFKKVGAGSYNLVFEIPNIKNRENCSLVVDFVDKIKALKYSNELTINFKSIKVNTKYAIYDDLNSDFPSFETFRLKGKPFYIKPVTENLPVGKLFLKKYKNNSLPALSPMSSTKRSILNELEADTLIEVNAKMPIVLNSTGVYVLTQTPDLHLDGYSFLVVDEIYPREVEPKQLKDAVVYMSTAKEIELIKNTPDAKTAMDLYFLNLSKGNEEIAKKTIKNYYRKVAAANKLFTTYKEGWKTDKGMVYVIMGPPNKVQKYKKREVWIYSQARNNSEISFTFYQNSNDFTDQSYDLVRYPEYSSFWYPYVEAWRTGTVAE